MSPENKSPIRQTDDEARTLARALIQTARFAALAVQEPETLIPVVSRVAFGTSRSGTPLTLISDLSHHTRCLKENPACSLLVGEPESKGDPLTHPRLTLQCHASFIEHADEDYKKMRDHYLITHPKAQLYIDFADFSFAIFDVGKAYLNGGFGKAFVLKPADLGLAKP